MCSPRHYRLQTSPNNTRHIMDTHTFLHTGSGLYNPLYMYQDMYSSRTHCLTAS